MTVRATRTGAHRYETTAVRAILPNPWYTGRQVWNRAPTDEVQIDVDDIALGHENRHRWNDPSQWVWSQTESHTPLISPTSTNARAEEVKKYRSRKRDPLRERTWLRAAVRRRQPHAAANAVGLRGDGPATSVEPFTASKKAMLTRSTDLETFLATWRFGDWNEFRIRCVGRLPTVTVWIHDLRVAEIDLGTLQAPHFDRNAVEQLLGSGGHIALEIHDNDPMLGARRWGPGARCRWRNIRLRELDY